MSSRPIQVTGASLCESPIEQIFLSELLKICDVDPYDDEIFIEFGTCFLGYFEQIGENIQLWQQVCFGPYRGGGAPEGVAINSAGQAAVMFHGLTSDFLTNIEYSNTFQP
jgi:hypothetical protein